MVVAALVGGGGSGALLLAGLEEPWQAIASVQLNLPPVAGLLFGGGAGAGSWVASGVNRAVQGALFVDRFALLRFGWAQQGGFRAPRCDRASRYYAGLTL